MTDLTPPPPNSPEFQTPPIQKKADNMRQASIVMLILAVLALAFGIVVALTAGDESSSQTPTTLAMVPNYDETPTYTVAPSVNKYDAYLEHVYNNSGKANTMDKSELIEFGDVVCQALDNGKTIGTIVGILENSSSDTRDAELYASIVFGSITYLCDEYEGDLRFYLSNAN